MSAHLVLSSSVSCSLFPGLRSRVIHSVRRIPLDRPLHAYYEGEYREAGVEKRNFRIVFRSRFMACLGPFQADPFVWLLLSYLLSSACFSLLPFKLFFMQCLRAFEGFNIYEVHLCPVCRQGYESVDPCRLAALGSAGCA